MLTVVNVAILWLLRFQRNRAMQTSYTLQDGNSVRTGISVLTAAAGSATVHPTVPFLASYEATEYAMRLAANVPCCDQSQNLRIQSRRLHVRCRNRAGELDLQPQGLGHPEGEGMMMDLVDAVEGAAGGEEYINGAARKVAAAVRSGKAYPEAAPRDNQLHGLVRLPIVVARYVGQPELREKVVEAVRSQQSGPEAEQFSLLAAAVLEKALLGTIATRDTLAALELEATTAAQGGDPTVQRLMESVTKAMERLKRLRHQGLNDKIQAVQDFGPSCHMPGSLLSTFALLAKPAPYADAVRGDILAGGDSAGRAHCIGALLAAQQGEDAIPEAWRNKVSALGHIEELTAALLEQRFAPGQR